MVTVYIYISFVHSFVILNVKMNCDQYVFAAWTAVLVNKTTVFRGLFMLVHNALSKVNRHNFVFLNVFANVEININ